MRILVAVFALTALCGLALAGCEDDGGAPGWSLSGTDASPATFTPDAQAPRDTGVGS